MSTPRVSIVVPLYNSERYLSLTLAGILGQSMGDFEVVLHDDGSSDRTLSIAREHAARDARVRLIISKHSGIAGARNNGFAATNPKSEFITFFDHDDVWEPNALALLVNALERNPECAAAHGLAQCILGTGERYALDDHAERTRKRWAVAGDKVVLLPLTEPTTFGALLIENYVTTPGTSLVRRPVMEAVGGFEASVEPCDDWDMNLRISRRGGFAFVNEVVINWRRHDTAASHLSNRWRQSFTTTRVRSIESTENTPAQRAEALFAFRHYLSGLRDNGLEDMKRGMFRLGARQLARSALLYTAYRRAERFARALP
jgi:glycosyltransferase involved in cell wall biosynthesis